MVIRAGIVFALIVAVAVMAYQIGSRLSDEAIMTLVGVSCGILASIPVSLGLLIALTRDRNTYVEETVDPEPAPAPYNIYRSPVPPHPQLPPQQQAPQIIVLSPPQTQLPPHLAAYPNYLLPPQSELYPAPMQERNFKIVGDDQD